MSEENSTLQDVAVVNEETVSNEADVAAPVQTEAPAAEAQPDPQETQPEEAETEVESGGVEVAAPAEVPSQSDKIRKLLRKLDVPDDPNEQLMETIDEESLDRLPANVRGLLRHLAAAQRQQLNEEQEKFKVRAGELDRKEAELRTKARDLIRNRAQLNRVLLDPKLQELIKNSDVPEDQLADPYSEEGIQQRIQRGVAQAMKAFQAPITDAAQRAQQMAAYQDFVEAHPLMREKQFKSEVRSIMEERKSSGADRNRILREQQASSEKERKARAASARRVQRSTQSSQPDVGDPVPNWVTEKGYDGARGQMARIKYLRDNPKALAKLREQQRRR